MKNIYATDKFNNDDIKFIDEVYGIALRDFLGTSKFNVCFFPDSENLVDEIKPSEEAYIRIDENNYSFSQDFSFDQKNILKDINFCSIDGYKIARIVTPFTRIKSYDFIITRFDESEEIIKKLNDKKSQSFIKRVPPHVIGIPIEEIERKTINFLLDENLRDFCKSRDIPLKRGVVFEGPPGVGKSMTLKFLRTKALNEDIEFEVFNSIKDFVERSEEYYSNEKKIFVFEDFDTALLDRETTDGTPNQVLGKILNTLDGIKEVDNVVSIFTTNKVKLFDDAFIRPGRIDTVFTFSLPTEDNIKMFIEKYLDGFCTDYIFKKIMESKKSVNISYAFLKGISDDLNIHNFFKETVPSEEDVNRIIEEKIFQTQKGDIKKSEDFIL